MMKVNITWGFPEDNYLPQENGFYTCITEEYSEVMRLYYSQQKKKFYIDHTLTFEIPVQRWEMKSEEEEL